MNLHSDYPFWLVKEGILADYTRLAKDAKADVVVIGGGISGALIGHELQRRGVDTIIVDKRHLGFGSTSASTALLQYEIDHPLHRLAGEVGDERAVRAFRLCGDAILTLEKICARLPGEAEFRRRPSLWYASYRKDVAKTLLPEYRARKLAGFDVRLLDESDMRRLFGFAAPAAILSALGATCNPYKLTNGLLAAFLRGGGRVHDLTEVAGWTETRSGLTLTTTNGIRVRARHIVVAAGYETQSFLDRSVTQFHTTYAIASKPNGVATPWHRNALIWETRTPYLYLRTTADRRIIVGGRDDESSDPRKRDASVGRKSRQLLADFRALFPGAPFDIDFAWGGTFGETRDGLPYIGTAGQKRVHYAMSYGGNGITFSVVAARLMGDAVTGRKNPDAAIFAFDR
ncbi:MAG: FAD-dependent oxidoreductase [Betaproteobacteria bacterium]